MGALDGVLEDVKDGLAEHGGGRAGAGAAGCEKGSAAELTAENAKSHQREVVWLPQEELFCRLEDIVHNTFELAGQSIVWTGAGCPV